MAKFVPSKYHRLPDVAYGETDEILEQLIADIESVYGQAYTEMNDKANEYLAWFVKEDDAQRKAWQSGEITLTEYRNWRQNKLLTGQHWFSMSATIAQDLANVNGIAYSIINDRIPEVYAINGNWATYQVEKQTRINTSFELFDQSTIERLIREKPDLLPKAKLDIPLDERWNKHNMQSAVMQSIIQGESVDELAERLAAVTDMNQSSAIRNAKTMVTSAQNGGRQDAYERAERLGIKGEKIWLATLDFHTRESHRNLDGSRIGIHEKFANGLMFPGDPAGEPAELYNCRCRTIEVFKDQEFSDFERHSRLGDMPYDEWKDAHGGEPEFKAARNANRDKDMWKEYKSLLGKKVPQKFSDFQEFKYNNTGEWKQMVSDARKARQERRAKNG